MRMLLTSAGIKNASIHDALVGLLGKPIGDCGALCIPTAAYGHPLKPGVGWKFISGQEPRLPMCGLGWKSLGVLELTALPSIDEERGSRWCRNTDVLLVGAATISIYHRCGVRVTRASCLPCPARSTWG